MIIGVIVEFFVLIPSLLFLQAFRFVQSTSSKVLHILLYIFAGLVMLTSIFFIIARGLEFGDEKSRRWLISILTGFFSSIFLTQPLKVKMILLNFQHSFQILFSPKIFCLSLFMTFLRHNPNKDKQIEEYLVDRKEIKMNRVMIIENFLQKKSFILLISEEKRTWINSI